MSGFKLLAIRPISQNLCKVLVPGQIYQFYNNYQFSLDDLGSIKNIVFTPDIPADLYNIQRRKPLKDIEVSISAIVGKNGSGKSTLLELLFGFCFILGYKKGLINLDYLRDKIPYENSNIIDLIDNFNVEIFYEYKNEIYQIYYNSKKVYQRKLINQKWQVTKFNYNEFFYTLATNYSLYGLNALESNWLYHLFHKNDGYQTPIVINPFRNNGAIDVNSENHLAQSRLLSNISSYFDNNPIIMGDKEIEELKFTLDPEEYDHVGVFPMKTIMDFFEKNNDGLTVFAFFNKISSALADFELSEKEITVLDKIKEIDGKEKLTEKYLFEKAPKKFTNNEIRYQFVKYTIRKVFKICSNYQEYNERFLKKKEPTKNGLPPVLELTNIDGLIRALKKDKSHLTLKLRQALFTIKSDFFKTIDAEVVRKTNNYKHYNVSLELDYKKYKSKVNIAFADNKTIANEKIEIIPGALVRPTVKFVRESDFMSLSSGELQFLHTYHTIIYHLYNINSVFESRKESNSKSNKVFYQNVNIVLDEIELYFHPQLQKSFIKELLDGIKRMNFEHINNINILFSTHSPFILSDIPAQNILKLVKGRPQAYDQAQQTFGANINDTLANDFFLKDGFMGDFVKGEINSLIEFIISGKKSDEKWNVDSVMNFIDLIGEPLIRMDIKELFMRKHYNDKQIDSEIERMKEIKVSRDKK